VVLSDGGDAWLWVTGDAWLVLYLVFRPKMKETNVFERRRITFCISDLLSQNLEEEARAGELEERRQESAVEIVEVNSDIGYLEETAACIVEEELESEEEIRGQVGRY